MHITSAMFWRETGFPAKYQDFSHRTRFTNIDTELNWNEAKSERTGAGMELKWSRMDLSWLEGKSNRADRNQAELRWNRARVRGVGIV
jgi:hypothetical protein